MGNWSPLSEWEHIYMPRVAFLQNLVSMTNIYSKTCHCQLGYWKLGAVAFYLDSWLSFCGFSYIESWLYSTSFKSLRTKLILLLNFFVRRKVVRSSEKRCSCEPCSCSSFCCHIWELRQVLQIAQSSSQLKCMSDGWVPYIWKLLNWEIFCCSMPIVLRKSR